MGKTLRKPHPTSARSRTTRSHKPRLLSDPSTSSNNLNAQLRALGLYPADTIGDGNCLFRALSDQLYGSPSRHTHLRAEVCDYIAGNRGRYEGFCEDERGLDVHMRCMRELGTYGGHMELSAFAHMVKRNVKVVQPGLVYVIEWGAGLSEEDREGALRRRAEEEEREGWEVCTGSVYVAYHDWEHFSSIRNLAGPHAGLPNVQEAPASSEYDGDEDGYDAKEREREKRRERKEKEKRKITRVKLKLSAPPSAASTPPPSQASSSMADPLSSLTSMSSLTSLAPSPSASASASSLPDSALPTPPPGVALGSLLGSSLAGDATLLPVLPSSALASASTTLLPDSANPPPSTTLPDPTNASASALPLSMRIHRSPKRSFDESASSEDGGSVVSEDVERGRGADKRKRVGSLGGSGSSMTEGGGNAGGEGGGEGVGNGVGEEREGGSEDEGGNREEGDTEEEEKEVEASISVHPSSPHVTPQEEGYSVTPQEIRDEGYSSLSELSDSPEPEGDDLEDDAESVAHGGEGEGDGEGSISDAALGNGNAGQNTSTKLKKKGAMGKKGGGGAFEKRVHVGEDGRPLTRKERKARGLPKFRGVPGSRSSISGSGGSGSGSKGSGGGHGLRKSAGRIVIPGGRFTGGRPAQKEGEEKEKEWVKTGVGRVDVRGFRELKI